MIYINQFLGPLGHFFVDMYEAVTLDDFINEKDTIPKPSKWKLVNPLTWGINKEVLIFVNNVTLRFENEGYVISDLTNSLFVNRAVAPGARSLFSAAHKNIAEGRYYELIIQYCLAEDRAYLYGTTRFGPLTPDPQADLERILDKQPVRVGSQ